MKDKIRDETRSEMSARAAEEKAKLDEKLDAQVAAKKLTPPRRKDRLAQHDELWRSKTENAIAQKIERAHLYSFNLPSYRSSLTPAQLAAWKDFAATYLRKNGSSETLETQYRAIATATPDELDALISGLDPRHTLELDIARQFLTGISPKLFTKHPHLRTLQGIIASQQKTPRIPLGEILKLRREVLPQEEYQGETDIIGKIRFSDGKMFMREDRTTESNLQWTEKGDLIISKINFHQGAYNSK